MASDTDSVGSPGSAEAQQNLVARLERLEAKVDAELSMLRACNERASSYYSKLLETRCLDVEQASREQKEQQNAALEAKCTELEKKFVSQDKLETLCRDVLQTVLIQHAELIESKCLKVCRASLEDFKGDTRRSSKKDKDLVPEAGSADAEHGPLMSASLDNTKELETIELSEHSPLMSASLDNIKELEHSPLMSASIEQSGPDPMSEKDVTEAVRALIENIEKLDQQSIQGLAPDVQKLKEVLSEKPAKPAAPDKKLLDLLQFVSAENQAIEQKVSKDIWQQVGTSARAREGTPSFDKNPSPSFADLSGSRTPPSPRLVAKELHGMQQARGWEGLRVRPGLKERHDFATGATTPGTGAGTPRTSAPVTKSPPVPTTISSLVNDVTQSPQTQTRHTINSLLNDVTQSPQTQTRHIPSMAVTQPVPPKTCGVAYPISPRMGVRQDRLASTANVILARPVAARQNPR